MALLSIITPAYNASKYIHETIQAVQNQTFQDWELVIVDDISTDNTQEIVQNLSKKDPRIRFFALPQKGGPALARNFALERASGKYIAFLDADDIWLPLKTQIQIEFMKQKNAAFSFTQFRRFTNNIQETGRLIDVPEKINYSELLKHNVIATLTTMIDREQTGDFKMVNEGYDDFICWLGLLKKVDFAYGIKQDLARYRIAPNSVSSKKLRAAGWVWNIYRNVEKLPLPKALYTFGQYAVRVSFKHSRF